MGPNRYRFTLLIVIKVLCFSVLTSAQSNEEQKITVVMRTIGHQALLLHGDSTSRVLPVEKTAENQYKIPFASAFTFDPTSIAVTIDSVVKAGGITTDYILEVQIDSTDEIIYSYQVEGKVSADLIPCGTRLPPEARYNIIFTMLNEHNLTSFLKANSVSIFVLFVLISTGAFITLRKKQPAVANPDVISIGNYKLDKRNMLLSFSGSEVVLSSKEADLLALLYDSVNQTLEREIILNTVWQDEGNYIGRTLDVFISKLRKKLAADPNIRIMNIRGVGYKMVVNGAG